ncbi:biopolymer transporter ExbD [Pseudodesulfovibrio sp. JC047]|uniref:ExbD/TolR family protein n=1 Tax=Pseudodesulfovibrio sp. JC047 TaxID=2683199 RepID=UPI0013D63ABA|nr:biopolymer transporter ExbD [Pseudodesulfovibrio sp. JC047]NDV18463.1 biopolymer transporter ExbD [Pseudodesulfovibrio sp. JC047]
MISFQRHTPRPASPDITPLLDVVFILLIFFVVSSVFTAKGMDMELPTAESSTPVSGKSMEIELRANGDILCDTHPVTLDALSVQLQSMAIRPLAQQPVHILLKSAPQATVEHFVRIVDMVRSNGFSNLVIATSTKPDPTPSTEGRQ